ncbi:IS21 family transposase [Shewanella putrefaciens]|uniref:IS21 family transposase n=1 Tax=Shewanella putrefaciens TaxID=24 RepID=UPI0021C2044F|nr:IS21 family transposase [Shewanella putrefaciens]UXK08002.1 IS21 family transposase [Shewanella putrefaciens]
MLVNTLRETLRLILTTQYSNRHIGRLMKVSANTVRRYRRRVPSVDKTWPQLSLLDDKQLLTLFTKPHQSTFNDAKRLPDWGFIHKMMQAKHQTLMQLWEEYRLISPANAYAYSQFTHYYRQFTRQLDISMRQVHYAGECVFIDYAGRTIPWIDPHSGQAHQAQIYVGVLGCSQYTFACACRSQCSSDFTQATVKMLQFFGGVPQVLVPDNLKSAVITPGKFPVLNRNFLELAKHYNCVIEPARVRKPQDKSLAELGVLQVTRWISVVLRRRRFFSLAEINEAIPELLNALNRRSFKRLTGSRLSRFEELDKPVLQSLPTDAYESAQWITAQKVPSDYHVYVLQHAYSVPFQYVGCKLEARVTDNKVEFFYQNRRVTWHVRQYGADGHSTIDEHRPKSHRAYAQQSSTHYLTWASAIGANTYAVAMHQFEGRPEHSIVGCRACSQLQSLARHYEPQRLESACQCACEIQSLTISSVRSILQCNIDQRHEQAEPKQGQLPLHVNVRGPEYYAKGGSSHE